MQILAAMTGNETMLKRCFLFPAACSLFLCPVRAELALAKGSTLLFYGNSLVERLLEHGELGFTGP